MSVIIKSFFILEVPVNTKTKRVAFTLVELLVVIAIIGILQGNCLDCSRPFAR